MSADPAFAFRPWVRRAGASIIAVALATTASVVLHRVLSPSPGWSSEPTVWLYVAALWAGGLKIWAGTWRPIVEIDDEGVTVRPIHTIRARRIPWTGVRGTEKMVPGDRMILYFDLGSGMRHVALNLNLVRGRRDLERELDARLFEVGFVERLVGRSRHLSRPSENRGQQVIER